MVQFNWYSTSYLICRLVRKLLNLTIYFLATDASNIGFELLTASTS